MTAYSLKLLAVAAMTIDHLGRMMVHFGRGDEILYAAGMAFHCAGRVAMPIFAFLIAEGYRHTRDRKRYIFRIGLFAILSEVPFDLMYAYGREWVDWSHQNILLGFFLSLLALEMYTNWMRQGRKWPAFFSVMACVALAQLLQADYGCFSVVLVFLFYLLESRRRETILLAGFTLVALGLWFCIIFPVTGWTQFFSLLALFPILRYTGAPGGIDVKSFGCKRGVASNLDGTGDTPGKRKLKWFFYAFYPVHMLLLGLVSRMLYT